LNSNEQDIDFIERYFRQELSPEEMETFEYRIKTDSVFAGEVIAMRDIFYTVRGYARAGLKLELAEIQSSLEPTEFKKYNPKKFKIMKWIGGGIVIMAAVIGIRYYAPHSIEKPIKEIPQKDSIEKVDSIIENATPSSTPPQKEEILIVEPSATTKNIVQPDIRLNVKDKSTFSVKKVGYKNGMYQYIIKADGKTYEVNNPSPDLEEQLMERAKKTTGSTVDTITNRYAQPKEGVDF